MLDTAGGLQGMLSRLPGEEERPRKVSEVRGSKAQGLHEGEGKGKRREKGLWCGRVTYSTALYVRGVIQPQIHPHLPPGPGMSGSPGACPSHRVDSKSTQVDPNNLLRSSQLPFHSWEN